MHTITKEFHFSASHQLFDLEEEHPCMRLHGHNYILILEFQGDPNLQGLIIDYRKLVVVKEWVDETLDHRHLEDVFGFQTSVENMSKKIYDMWKNIFPQLSAVEMSETPKTNCRYEPKNN